MSRQPHRLPADAKHGFGGNALDRTRPLTFRLNGRPIDAFHGDTVLTAALAAGITTVGTRNGEPIALDETTAPPVMAKRGGLSPEHALPMERLPAANGLDLVTVGPRRDPLHGSSPLSGVARLFGQASATLGLRLDDRSDLVRPWRQLPATETLEADTVVVGGGVAGMSAAVAAASHGDRVVLVERRTTLGGDARFFGTVGDEAAPDTAITRLIDEMQKAAVVVLLSAEALSVEDNCLHVHQISLVAGKPAARALLVRGKRLVLATGARERLPLFAGNRLPGIVGAIDAFNRAERHGLWNGKDVSVNAPTNFAFRLALLASDAGRNVLRITDPRLATNSRFVDFAKASAIKLTAGLLPRSATQAGRSRKLLVDFALSFEGAGSADSLETDQLIAGGGLQPELGLWLAAGGRCGWDQARCAVVPRGGAGDTAIVGAAAGYRNMSACIHSGKAAINLLHGRHAEPTEDRQIDPIYETPDAPTPVAPFRVPDRMRVHLDRGLSFAVRPMPGQTDATSFAAAHGQAPTLFDVAAATQLGAIPASETGAVAEERCLVGGDIVTASWRPKEVQPTATPQLPPYLIGRFVRPQMVRIEASDARYFEVGSLVFPNSAETSPLAAIGVVFSAASGGHSGGIAVLGKTDISTLHVRDGSRAVSVRVAEKVEI